MPGFVLADDQSQQQVISWWTEPVVLFAAERK